jgi:hypothetical protein
MSDYKITKQDIDAIVRYLQIYHPDKANREYAQAMLDYIKSGLHKIAHDNPDNIEVMYENYENYLNNERE